MMRAIRIVVLLVATVGLGCTAEGPEEGGEAEAPATEVILAPDFTLQDLEGNEISLSSLRGKTVLIDFWATWCPPCEYQIPILNEVHAAHQEQGVEVLGVSVDVDGIDVVKPYSEEHKIQYTVLLGDEALAREFGAPGFPVLVVVAPDGTVANMHVGLVERPELEALIAQIKGPAPAHDQAT